MIISLAAMALGATVPALTSACAATTAPYDASTTLNKDVSAEDIAGLRDIGVSDYGETAPGLSVSPDGRWVALQLKRAVPSINSYCLEIVAVPTEGSGPVRVIDQGGTLLLSAEPRFEYGPVYTGIPVVVRPLWSPDGSAIAYLKRVNGQTRACVAYLDGRASTLLDHGSGDAVRVAWGPDSRALAVTAVQLAQLEHERDIEALSGYHLDDRFIPSSSNRPYLKAPFPTVTRNIDLPSPSATTHRLAPATPAFFGWVEMTGDAGKPQDSVTERLAQNGVMARCRAEACSGRIGKLWKSSDGKEFSFLRREGTASDQYALYHWRRGSGEVVRRYLTKGLLLDCQPTAGTDLVCAHEEATRPRHIVSLDPRTGRMLNLYDPNPEFAVKAFGTVERLYWKNDRDIPAFADLVLPPNHHAGERHPLIIVSYSSRGFLRGGTGDEYPILALAAHGYAVMSFDMPPDIGSFAKGVSAPERSAINRKNWANRRSVESSLERGIKLIEEKGVINPSKMGITGFSDGSSSLWFALINSKLFQAAAVSHCCEEPVGSMALVGSRTARYFEEGGYPGILQDDPAVWAPMSVMRNAHRIDVPVLLNLSSDEYLWSLETIRALRFHHQLVDAYVFPDEYHVKQQPAHRLAIYRRNIAWFDYWLRDILPPQRDERSRWQEMRGDAGPSG
ncbi:Atxe2 family lasso peptide isopeptidase [Sphingobium sp. D43FB]|uniref:Atxe2 family lasso peptide isopeptidase n=1 Tax=Sphingobium sp. D43FB TaxID=2017595 RepID=UPI0020D1B424|nr:Atxe2 family lasso peptide isopeptidase [Sphingobium sp. D43FB]